MKQLIEGKRKVKISVLIQGFKIEFSAKPARQKVRWKTAVKPLAKIIIVP